MAQLAIQGHVTRGSEVIALLEMMGGKNHFHMDGFTEEYIYYICGENNQIHSAICPTNQIVFTIEEFLKKFPYKVGDKVSSKYLKNYEISKMEWESINNNNRVIYKLREMGWYSADELQPYKEETMETITIDDFKANTKEWLIDKLHGMIISDAVKTISNIHDELHKPKYPKTYAECCEVLSLGKDGVLYTEGYKASLIQDFQKLIICRDVYWKIAGEEMGLEKPWEPDFDNEYEYKYGLFRLRNSIYKDATCINPTLLIFPTKEMRDAFYDNFKELIEICKELL